MTTRKPKPRTLGVEIDALIRERNKIRKAEAKLKEMKSVYEENWMAVRGRMVDEDMDQGRGKLGTASVGTRDHANIEDYGRLEKYIYRTKALDLLQSRVSITAVRERMKEGKKVPGVSIYHKPVLNLSTRSK